MLNLFLLSRSSEGILFSSLRRILGSLVDRVVRFRGPSVSANAILLCFSPFIKVG
jgi:hypothetical protein